jgi:hypothetical protein
LKPSISPVNWRYLDNCGRSREFCRSPCKRRHRQTLIVPADNVAEAAMVEGVDGSQHVFSRRSPPHGRYELSCLAAKELLGRPANLRSAALAAIAIGDLLTPNEDTTANDPAQVRSQKLVAHSQYDLVYRLGVFFQYPRGFH